MTVSVDSFRSDFNSQFGNEDTYPVSSITYWLAIAAMLLNKSRWGEPSATADSPPTTPYDFGTELFIAHNLALEKMAADAAAAGTAPGLSRGPVSSKSVGPASVSYDSSVGLELDAGHWNLTTYGTRFIKLARMMGSGPVQVGVGCAPPFSLGAWPGPWQFPQQGGTNF